MKHTGYSIIKQEMLIFLYARLTITGKQPNHGFLKKFQILLLL